MFPNRILERTTPFIHDTMGVNPPALKCVTHADGYRLYQTPEGKWYPSMTTVLAAKGREWLADWKNTVGEEFAKRHSGYATRRGTILHKALEVFIRENRPIDLNEYMPDVRQMLIQTVPVLDSINRVILQEKGLYSDELELAGTPDLVAVWKNEIAVCDFKNSYQPKEVGKIEGYFAQCTGYAKMLHEKHGLRATKIVVIIAVEGSKTQVFEDKVRMKHYDYLLEAIDLHNKNREQPWQRSNDAPEGHQGLVNG